MKTVFLAATLLILNLKSFAQDWGDWIDVGHEIQVSFKYSKKGCDGYTYARIKNVSDKNTFCKVRISFSKTCNNGFNNEAAVSAYKIRPGEISQSSGDWFNTERILDLKLTTLENNDCKDVLKSVPTSGGANEIIFEKRPTPEDEYRRKLDSLKADEEKKEKERQEKLEKQKKEIDEQAKRDKEKHDQEEKKALKKTESIVNSNVSPYPNTEEGKLRAKNDADARKRLENAQALNAAIPSLVENTLGIIKGIQDTKEARQKKASAYYAEEKERKEIIANSLPGKKEQALNGNIDACLSLGKLYTYTDPSNRNLSEAIKWLKLGTFLGSTNCFVFLSEVYRIGDSHVNANPALAFAILKEAALIDNKNAFTLLGRAYSTKEWASGYQIKTDKKTSQYWFNQVAHSKESVIDPFEVKGLFDKFLITYKEEEILSTKILAEKFNSTYQPIADKDNPSETILVSKLSASRNKNSNENDGFFNIRSIAGIAYFINKNSNVNKERTKCNSEGKLNIVWDKQPSKNSLDSFYTEVWIDLSKIDTNSFKIIKTFDFIYLHFTGEEGVFESYINKFTSILDGNSEIGSWASLSQGKLREGKIPLNKDLLLFEKQYILKDFVDKIKYFISNL